MGTVYKARDPGLKLSSIVFDREGEPYVTDFAIASRVDEQTKHVFFGSPEFLAPEQWEGAVGAPSADQYSLAVLTYFLLAGSCPFEGQIDPKVREKNFARAPCPHMRKPHEWAGPPPHRKFLRSCSGHYRSNLQTDTPPYASSFWLFRAP